MKFLVQRHPKLKNAVELLRIVDTYEIPEAIFYGEDHDDAVSRALIHVSMAYQNSIVFNATNETKNGFHR